MNRIEELEPNRQQFGHLRRNVNQIDFQQLWRNWSNCETNQTNCQNLSRLEPQNQIKSTKWNQFVKLSNIEIERKLRNYLSLFSLATAVQKEGRNKHQRLHIPNQIDRLLYSFHFTLLLTESLYSIAEKILGLPTAQNIDELLNGRQLSNWT